MKKLYSGKKNRKSICITGGGFVNKGAEAMILTIVENIRKQLPDSKIYIRIKTRDFQQARMNDLIPIKKDQPTSLVSRLFSKLRYAKTYYHCKVFIDIGGYQFGDPWGNAAKKAKSIKHCVKFGNLMFFMPQAWGPFSIPGIVESLRSIFNYSTLCYVRDNESLSSVQKIAGTEHEKIRFAHDIAWNFQGAETHIGRQLIEDAGLTQDDSSITVCVTPNLRIYERFNGSGTNNEYLVFLAKVIEHLCLEHNAKVLLLGHELRLDNTSIKDDRTLCNYLLSLLDKSLPVVHLDKFLTAAEVKSVIGNCDLLVSSRYHALIAALSQEIPVAAIGWSHKYDELLTEVGLSSHLISPESEIEGALVNIDSICESLPQNKEIIRNRIATFKQSGQNAIDEVLTIIKERFEA
ncbi:MAG: polysaccharide pyruvyl transferase family protein [Planctomycetes bacterium]|nr:polysaccharide pyruvyl transferase family protein [Planctomycetota bacterium]